MAEGASQAFGRYMRDLRERAGLSLLEVSRIAEQSTEPINKGALSRLERGLQAPTLFKLSALCRIYGVSIEVVVERLELDREADRDGVVHPAAATFDELMAEGRRALVQANLKLTAYVCFRDAIPLAAPPQQAPARINLATAARSLGKNRLALHELRVLLDSEHLDPGRLPLVLDRISNCHRCLGELEQARDAADRAIDEARANDDAPMLAFALNSRANVAVDRGEPAEAIEFLQQAFRVSRDDADGESVLTSNPGLEVNTLLMIGDCNMQLGRIGAAKRDALAARKLAERHDLPAGRAYSEVLLGQIDREEGHHERARDRWRSAVELARGIENRRLEFWAEVELFRQAVETGSRALARAAERRLKRLEPWVPRHLPEITRLNEWRARLRADRIDTYEGSQTS